MNKIDWIGWLATAVFLVSYFTKTPVGLRRVGWPQACGHCTVW